MKTLIYDIEIMHDYGEDYQRRMYSGYVDTSVRMSADISRISHFGYKWLGEGRALCKDLTDFPSFHKNGEWVENEKDLLTFISDLFRSADHLVAHYGDKFDRRYVNAKLLKHNLPPIPPAPGLKQTDTCKISREHLKLSSNRLDNISRFLGVPMKRTKNWPADWLKMTSGDKAAFERVKTYCIGDIISLEQVFLRLRPFCKGLPNHNLVNEEFGCPACGSGNYMKYGTWFTLQTVRQRYRCKDCSRVFPGEIKSGK